MKKLAVALCAALVAFSTPAFSKGSMGGARPSYGGGHHSSSHGGHYAGGKGSSHKGGRYTNSKSANRYGKHK
ncbi:MAG: hypothetical protein K2X55_12745 [Burkholderiaceae bacterium]|nr:hypothetical protein [Burkholderiaceae bacterium]